MPFIATTNLLGNKSFLQGRTLDSEEVSVLRKFSPHNWFPISITDEELTQFLKLLHEHERQVSEIPFRCDKNLDDNDVDSIEEFNGWVLVKDVDSISDGSNGSDDEEESKDKHDEYMGNNFTIIQQENLNSDNVGNIDDARYFEETASITNQEILSEEVSVKLSSQNESKLQCGEFSPVSESNIQLCEKDGEKESNKLKSGLKIEVEEAKISSIYQLEDNISPHKNKIDNEAMTTQETEEFDNLHTENLESKRNKSLVPQPSDAPGDIVTETSNSATQEQNNANHLDSCIKPYQTPETESQNTYIYSRLEETWRQIEEMESTFNDSQIENNGTQTKTPIDFDTVPEKDNMQRDVHERLEETWKNIEEMESNLNNAQLEIMLKKENKQNDIHERLEETWKNIEEMETNLNNPQLKNNAENKETSSSVEVNTKKECIKNKIPERKWTYGHNETWRKIEEMESKSNDSLHATDACSKEEETHLEQKIIASNNGKKEDAKQDTPFSNQDDHKDSSILTESIIVNENKALTNDNENDFQTASIEAQVTSESRSIEAEIQVEKNDDSCLAEIESTPEEDNSIAHENLSNLVTLDKKTKHETEDVSKLETQPCNTAINEDLTEKQIKNSLSNNTVSDALPTDINEYDTSEIDCDETDHDKSNLKIEGNYTPTTIMDTKLLPKNDKDILSAPLENTDKVTMTTNRDSKLQDQKSNLKIDVNICTNTTHGNADKTVMSAEIVTTIKREEVTVLLNDTRNNPTKNEKAIKADHEADKTYFSTSIVKTNVEENIPKGQEFNDPINVVKEPTIDITDQLMHSAASPCSTDSDETFSSTKTTNDISTALNSKENVTMELENTDNQDKSTLIPSLDIKVERNGKVFHKTSLSPNVNHDKLFNEEMSSTVNVSKKVDIENYEDNKQAEENVKDNISTHPSCNGKDNVVNEKIFEKEVQTNGTSTLTRKAAVYPNSTIYGKIQSWLSDMTAKYKNENETKFSEEDEVNKEGGNLLKGSIISSSHVSILYTKIVTLTIIFPKTVSVSNLFQNTP